MPNSSSSSSADERPVRTIRAHTKSRLGCRNCKLRRVKCDESKPQCNRCTSFGVACNYGGRSSDLEIPAQHGASSISVLRRTPCSTNRTIGGIVRSYQPLAEDKGLYLYDIREEDMELLYKFQTRTAVVSPLDKSISEYRMQTFDLVSKHSYYTHTVLALTLMHNRHLLLESPLRGPRQHLPPPKLFTGNKPLEPLTKSYLPHSNLLLPPSQIPNASQFGVLV